ncbi:MAG: hypothetical protein Q9187_007719, partial [Circinaria calcarea]
MAAPGLSTPSTPESQYTSQISSSSSGANRFLRHIGGSQQVPPPANFRSSRPSTTNAVAGPLHISTAQNLRHEELEPPLSPDTKRRRFGNGNYAPIRAGSGPLTPFPFPNRRESLPRPEFMHKPQFSMAAPPRPYPHNASLHDTNLTLPPLKTSSISEASPQAKSVEAMIMSIPHINKIKVLAKISPPLAVPGPTSPQHAIRGAIVAIDGQDSESVNAVVKYLSDFLSKEDEYKARVWRTPGLTLPASSETSFANYLQLITHWHSIAQEVVKHITTLPTPPSPPPISPKTIPPEISQSGPSTELNKKDSSPSSPPA